MSQHRPAGCGSIGAASQVCRTSRRTLLRLGRPSPRIRHTGQSRVRAGTRARARGRLPTHKSGLRGGSRGLGRTYFFLLELLLLELDLLALLFEPELDALFFDPLELPDLVGMATLPFRRAKPLAAANGSGPGP